MRRLVFVANWKMHKVSSEAIRYVESLGSLLADPLDADLVIAPSHVLLPPVRAALDEARLFGRVDLAAQNIFPKLQGAYTGEVSVPMVADQGCRYVLVGHSERRTYFGEDDRLVAEKVKAVLAGGLCPILCVGEKLDEREAGQARSVVLRQLDSALGDLPSVKSLLVAYEPVWAIGTGKHIRPSDANDMHERIRHDIEKRFGKGTSYDVRIVYGGSVVPENIGAFIQEREVDGALIGGAGLEPERFIRIARQGLLARKA